MGKKMMHIGLEKGQIGRYVFLPGSPERTEKIAAYFENPKEIAYNREFRTFVGQLNGVDVAVTSTGIGGPSAGSSAIIRIIHPSHTLVLLLKVLCCISHT